MNKVGVIGLGNMGSAIIKQVNCNGFHVVGFDIDEEKRRQIKELDIKTSDDIKEVVKESDFLILSMPNSLISKKVIEENSPLMKDNSVIIETSTVLPDEMNTVYDVCSKNNINIIDAAILGGVDHMHSHEAELLVGDSNEVYEKSSPVLKSFSEKIHLMGKVGSGMAAKIINNGVAHAVMTVIVESASLAIKMGIDPESVYQLLKGETALTRPLTHRYNERIRNGNYDGGMSTENVKKDSTLLLNLAQENGIPLFSIQSAHTVYEIATKSGLSKYDYSSISKLWEEWGNIDFTEGKAVLD